MFRFSLLSQGSGLPASISGTACSSSSPTMCRDIREEERKAIARDVHDELGQLLTTLKMHIFWLSRNAASMLEQRQARYESMLGIINETLDWSKDLATRLRPVILDNLSLGESCGLAPGRDGAPFVSAFSAFRRSHPGDECGAGHGGIPHYSGDGNEYCPAFKRCQCLVVPCD